ncbi:hypothetical protein [Sphingomonas mollis]|uniref:Uncharacterized protein n=1 Tax=Sphingomonas mollis TaxID=2795726 RepID=A0ABS0XMW1_9SPHN|nr:hypothetical protein [Sphingomonas sp. BT553]MBJ6121377.1 hypothetical protein [Sphingomonas sp. BT553]
MLIITDAAALTRTLTLPIADTIKRILLLRGDLIELATFIVPEAGDTFDAIERAVGLPLTDSFEWVIDHGGAYEAPYILSDDGSGVILIVPDDDGISPRLMTVLRDHAQQPEHSDPIDQQVVTPVPF